MEEFQQQIFKLFLQECLLELQEHFVEELLLRNSGQKSPEKCPTELLKEKLE